MVVVLCLILPVPVPLARVGTLLHLHSPYIKALQAALEFT